jgi:hypothetical protein
MPRLSKTDAGGVLLSTSAAIPATTIRRRPGVRPVVALCSVRAESVGDTLSQVCDQVEEVAWLLRGSDGATIAAFVSTPRSDFFSTRFASEHRSASCKADGIVRVD